MDRQVIALTSLVDALAHASLKRSRLVFVSNVQASNVELANYTSIDLNVAISERLIAVSKRERAKEVVPATNEIVSYIVGDVGLVTGLEILFDRNLAVDPLHLLAGCAKTKTLLVCWPEEVSDSGISYAVPSHPEYRRYRASDLNDMIYLTADAQLH